MVVVARHRKRQHANTVTGDDCLAMITDPASFAYNDPHQGKGTEYPQLVHPESNEGKDWQANVCAYITELFEWNVTEVAEGWQRKFQLLCAFQRDKGYSKEFERIWR